MAFWLVLRAKPSALSRSTTNSTELILNQLLLGAASVFCGSHSQDVETTEIVVLERISFGNWYIRLLKNLMGVSHSQQMHIPLQRTESSWLQTYFICS